MDFDWPAFVEDNQNNTSLLGEKRILKNKMPILEFTRNAVSYSFYFDCTLRRLINLSSKTVKLSNKARFLRQELSNFHRFTCRVLLRGYSFDLPFKNGKISV